MNKIALLLSLCITFGTCLDTKRTTEDGDPVIVSQYKYDIPVHHTPPKEKYYYPYPHKEITEVKPHKVYGVPDTIFSEDVPKKPDQVLSVPEIIIAKNVPEKPHEVYGVPKIIIAKDVPEKPHDIYGVPSSEDVHIKRIPVEVVKTPRQTDVITKLEQPALVYGVSDVPLKPEIYGKFLIEVLSEVEPGKPALIYGIPDDVHITIDQED